VRTISQGIDGLRAKVKGLLDGLEAEVDLAIDVMLPPDRLGRVLRAFKQEFPTVQLKLHMEALGAIAAMVLDRKAIVGISGPLSAGVEGLESRMAGSVAMVPVAAPDHPLGRAKEILPGMGREYTQLVLTDRSRFTEGAIIRSPARRPGAWPTFGQARAARRDRLGQHAAADDRRRPGGGHAGAAAHARSSAAPIASTACGGAIPRPARPPRGCSTSSWNWARRTANSKVWATSSTGQPRQHDIVLPMSLRA
jgi:DNA-binding transcriptional LysR family regulator